MLRALGFSLVLVLQGIAPVRAQQGTVEARQGQALARRVCAACHGIVPGAPAQVAGAPNFDAIAATPGMSPIALRVALQTPHHSMPNLMLSADEMRDITAYIMSLQPPK